MTFRLEYQDEGGKWIKLAKSYPSLADAKEQAEMKFFRHIPVKIIEERAWIGRPTEQPAAQASNQPTEEPIVAQAEEPATSSASKQTRHPVYWTKEELNFVAMAVEERLAKIDCWPLEPRNHAETNKLGGFSTIVMKAQEILDPPRQKSLKGVYRMLDEVRRVANKLHRARLKGGTKAPPDKKVTTTCPVCFKVVHKRGLANHMAWHNKHGNGAAVPAIPEAEPLGPPVAVKQADNTLARLVEKRVEELVEAAVQRVLKRILG
jgi:hypothetical protein